MNPAAVHAARAFDTVRPTRSGIVLHAGVGVGVRVGVGVADGVELGVGVGVGLGVAPGVGAGVVVAFGTAVGVGLVVTVGGDARAGEPDVGPGVGSDRGGCVGSGRGASRRDGEADEPGATGVAATALDDAAVREPAVSRGW